MKKIIVALFAIAVIRPAFAKDTWYPTFGPDGNHLTVACKAALRVMDANNRESIWIKAGRLRRRILPGHRQRSSQPH